MPVDLPPEVVVVIIDMIEGVMGREVVVEVVVMEEEEEV